MKTTTRLRGTFQRRHYFQKNSSSRLSHVIDDRRLVRHPGLEA